MKLKSHWWWDLSTKDFSETDMSKVVAVLPVAAVEQHGPHLPVRVDSAINAGIMERVVDKLPDDLPVLILPMQAVGKSVEHNEYPGTLTLSYETLARCWYEIAESVCRAGCRKIVFANSHGGQPQVIDIVCRELRVKLGMFAVSARATAGADMSDLFSAHEEKHGIHGGEYETSALLALHPDLVSMEHADDFVPVSVKMEEDDQILTPEGAIGFGWQTQDLHPSGACGNAAAADAERGAVALDRGAERFVALLREVADFPLERITRTTMFNGA
ncbi:creatininase family protein [Rhodobacterales bacterium]|nr:creatininase family protein [Rhodobacterales bacterium]